MHRRQQRTTALVVALVVVAALLASLALAACGSDKYSGTWKTTSAGEEVKMKIEKNGDKWSLSDATGKDTTKLEATEDGGKLIVKNPDEPTETMTIERKDDKLVMTLKGASIELTKE